MRLLTFSSLTLLASQAAAGPYVLEDDYSPASFFSKFDFFKDPDPTLGYVTYLDQTAALDGGLVVAGNESVSFGVDHTNIASGSGRESVRLVSKKNYTHGLIVADIAHMPGGICGTWPAFWMTGPNWPDNGEIDIVEGVNSATFNGMTLHTNATCNVSRTDRSFTGTMVTSDCYVNATEQPANAGCSITAQQVATYGTGFNAAGGGVYAVEWTSDAIDIYFFPRGQIPADVAGGNPDPSGWGEPLASFSGSCDIDSHFANQQIVFDTSFCGEWAGAVWNTDPVCSLLAPTCESFVQNQPSAFGEAYWKVNVLQVYTLSNLTVSTQSLTSTPGQWANATSEAPTSTLSDLAVTTLFPGTPMTYSSYSTLAPTSYPYQPLGAPARLGDCRPL